MSRPALPEERGADLRTARPTLAELRAAHAFERESRDLYDPGDGLRADGNQPVMDRRSTGFGLANEAVTWFCSVWCREAAAGVPAVYRCLTQTSLDDFDDNRNPDAPGSPVSSFSLG